MYEKASHVESGLLSMSHGQNVYWEESGTRERIPLLYLHGGPGETLASGSYVAKADPDRFRVVGLDQRGAGGAHASDPQHGLRANTTARLIADIEELRAYLGVEQWFLNGVSWGSTLAIWFTVAASKATAIRRVTGAPGTQAAVLILGTYMRCGDRSCRRRQVFHS